MGLLDKKIPYKSHIHCHDCITYQQQLMSIAINNNKEVLNLKEITPNCMWYIEHVLNGNEKDTKNCIWHLSTHRPAPISQ